MHLTLDLIFNGELHAPLDRTRSTASPIAWPTDSTPARLLGDTEAWPPPRDFWAAFFRVPGGSHGRTSRKTPTLARPGHRSC